MLLQDNYSTFAKDSFSSTLKSEGLSSDSPLVEEDWLALSNLSTFQRMGGNVGGWSISEEELIDDLSFLSLWLNHSWPLCTADSLWPRSNTLFSAWAPRSHWCKLISTFFFVFFWNSVYTPIPLCLYSDLYHKAPSIFLSNLIMTLNSLNSCI